MRFFSVKRLLFAPESAILIFAFPGVAQMVERVVWERIGIHPTGSTQNAGTP